MKKPKKFGVNTLEGDKAAATRNAVLKRTLPFGVSAVCGSISVLVYRIRKKNEKIYWEKQKEEKKLGEVRLQMNKFQLIISI